MNIGMLYVLPSIVVRCTRYPSLFFKMKLYSLNPPKIEPVSLFSSFCVGHLQPSLIVDLGLPA